MCLHPSWEMKWPRYQEHLRAAACRLWAAYRIIVIKVGKAPLRSPIQPPCPLQVGLLSQTTPRCAEYIPNFLISLCFLGYPFCSMQSINVQRKGTGHCSQPCYQLWPYCLNNFKPSKNKYTRRVWLYSAPCLAALLKHPGVLAELFSIIFDTSITPFILKCFSNTRPPLESNLWWDSRVFP